MTQLEIDKQAFIAIYLGSDAQTPNGNGKLIGLAKDEVFVSHRGYENKGYTFGFVFIENEYHIKDIQIELKPLSEISVEDSIEVSDICGTFTETNVINRLIDGSGYTMSNVKAIELTDFLRSKSYLIPFRHYSVDQILEMGWAKYKRPSICQE